jgi:hypothetical protein
MPTYYFDLKDDHDAVVVDDAGVELRDVSAAHSEAMRTLSHMTYDGRHASERLHSEFAIYVRDAEGPVMEVRASLSTRYYKK